MTLDVTTLLAAVLVNALLMSLALSVAVGLRSRSGLRDFNLSLLAQAAGWALLIAAGLWPRHAIWSATLGVTLLSLSISAMRMAIARFLAQAVPVWQLLAPPLLLGPLHALVYGHTVAAVALTNALIAVQVAHCAGLLLLGSPPMRRWRWLVGLSALANALLMLARAGLIVFATERYPRFNDPHWLNIGHLLLLNASLVLGTIGFLLAHRDEAEQALKRLASTDSLTGLHNRRVWLERSERSRQSADPARPDMLMLFDLDHFKQINDQRGHPVGDQVLALVGEVLRDSIREGDVAGRYGGEEFCLLLRRCGEPQFRAFDERLHQLLAQRSAAELGFAVQFSAGAVALPPGLSLADAMARADQALYRAKSQGRDRTCLLPG